MPRAKCGKSTERTVDFYLTGYSVCGDDPFCPHCGARLVEVLPAYAGMILGAALPAVAGMTCSPRMRG